MSDSHQVTVNILNREYQVNCPPAQEAGLIEAATYLNTQMRKIQQAGKVAGPERIAIMAALNISYELLQLTAQSDSAAAASISPEAATGLSQKITAVLASFRDTENG